MHTSFASKKEKSLYVCCPANALRGPAESARYQRRAAVVAEWMEAPLSFSPLMKRFMGSASRFSVDDRVQDLHPVANYDMVWAVRGGYGSIQLLEKLHDTDIGACELLGFSDITSLHALWRQRGNCSFYGTPPEQPDDTRAGQSLRHCCRKESFHSGPEQEAMVRILRTGNAQGPAFAACLTVLAHLCGTPYMPDLAGCLLFVEDVNEAPWQWDAALYQLYYAGALNNVQALVGGCATHKLDDDYAGPSVDTVLREWGDRLQVPVLSRLPFGHLDDALVIPCGWTTSLCAAAEWSIQWTCPASHPST